MRVSDYLNAQGLVVERFLDQDSGNVAYVVESAGRRRWLKVLNRDRTPIDDPKGLVQFYNSIAPNVVPRNWEMVEVDDGMLLECDWVPGSVLSSPSENRADSTSAYQRFRRLRLEDQLRAFNSVLALFVEIEAMNVVVEDFYDGCIIYDFDGSDVYVCDLDHVHWGSYVLDRERQYGSSRFMAPEEWHRGSVIDHRTNVYTLGATGFVMLADNDRTVAGCPMKRSSWEVLKRATSDDARLRQSSIREFSDDWHRSLG